VLDQAAEEVLQDLRRAGAADGFYLAGGTGLALWLGHRRSVDLDFFSREMFSEEALLQRVQGIGGMSVVSRDDQTLHADIRGVKVSFLGYPYRARRDFIDLYVVAREHGLKSLLDLFHSEFAKANYSRLHILKSLTYFEDAEREPMPEMLAPVAWPEVKAYFQREALRLGSL